MSSQAVQSRLAAAQAKVDTANAAHSQAQDAFNAAQATLTAAQAEVATWTQLAAEEDAEQASVQSYGTEQAQDVPVEQAQPTEETPQ